MSDDRYRTVIRRGLAPRQADLPPGPSFDDVLGRLPRATTSRRQPGWLVALVAAAVTILVIGVAAFLRSDPRAPTQMASFDTADARASATTWWQAVIDDDTTTASAIAHSAASFEYPDLSQLVNSVGRPVTITIDDEGFGSSDQPQLCYTLTGQTGRQYGSVVFRDDGGSWRVWEMRPSADRCGGQPNVTTTQPQSTSTTVGSQPDVPDNVPFDVGPLAGRGGHSVVWTGVEMIVWGGWGDGIGSTQYADGAAYNPATGSWRMITGAPLNARRYHLAAWTGSEMLIVGGDRLRDGAAYDPATDSWRSIADIPIPVSDEPVTTATSSVWTGEELIVWHVKTDEVAAYSPVADEWRELSPVGLDIDTGVLRVAGSSLYAFGADVSAYPGRVPLLGAVLGGDNWRALPAAAMWTDEYNIAASPEYTAWIGDRFLAWTDSGPNGRTLEYLPAAGDWVDAPPIPTPGCEANGSPVLLDGRVLAFNWCGVSALYDPANRSWTPVTIGGNGDARYAVWTGSELLNWGDTCCYGSGGEAFTVHAWRYVPPRAGDPVSSTTTTVATLTTYAVGNTVFIDTDCPSANPILRSDIGDGLPKKGQTEHERVERVLAENKDDLIDTFGAIDAIVVPRNGQVWEGPGNGDYTIEDATDYQVMVTLGPDSVCPSGPYSWNGIPVVFFRD